MSNEKKCVTIIELLSSSSDNDLWLDSSDEDSSYDLAPQKVKKSDKVVSNNDKTSIVSFRNGSSCNDRKTVQEEKLDSKPEEEKQKYIQQKEIATLKKELFSTEEKFSCSKQSQWKRSADDVTISISDNGNNESENEKLEKSVKNVMKHEATSASVKKRKMSSYANAK